MKRASVVLMCCLLFAGGAAHATSLGAYFLYGADSLKAICKGIDNSFDCARAIEARALRQIKFAKREAPDLLKLILVDQLVELKDASNAEGDLVKAHSYLGFDKSLNLHIVHIQYYEGSSIAAFDASSGQRIDLRGVPVASPDRKQFLSWDGDEAYGQLGFEVWARDSGDKAWRKSYEQGNDAKGSIVPEDVRWVTNRSIRARPGYSKEVCAKTPDICRAHYFIRSRTGEWQSAH